MPRPSWEAEFAEYYTARMAALRRLAYALCGDWHVAEDLTQHAFLKLYRHWRRIRPESVDAYSRRTLVNTFLTHRRDRHREVLEPVPDLPEVGADPDDRMDLRRALAALAPRQRAMVVLRHLEDLSVAEVAAILDVAEGTVKSQTARGVDALRRALDSTKLTREG